MQSEWPLVRLGDLVDSCLGKMLDAKKNKGELQPYLGNVNVRWGAFDLSDLSEMRFEPHEEERYGLLPGDLVVCEGGEPGRCAIWTGPVQGMKIQKALHRIRPKASLYNYYLYYWFRHAANVGLLEQHFTGTTIKHLTGKAISALAVPLPPVDAQRAMVEVLRRIDDRIDLLRQTNATLESIAQALFKSWFIDFDPVRAKQAGREPEGMDAATAALFPAEFEESALGWIPKGWRVSTLAEHVSAERGLSYKGAGLRDAGQGVPMHNLNSVLEGGGYKYAGLKHYSGDFKDRHTVRGGEVIVANTEQGHEHRLIGFPAIVPMRYERAIFSHHIYRVRLRPDSPLTVHTLYHMLMAPAVREQVIGCANGSTVNMLKMAGLEIPQFVCPSSEVATTFEAIAQPLRRQAEANVERIDALTELRDTLLPRLISGKLRVPEAQEQLEDIPA